VSGGQVVPPHAPPLERPACRFGDLVHQRTIRLIRERDGVDGPPLALQRRRRAPQLLCLRAVLGGRAGVHQPLGEHDDEPVPPARRGRVEGVLVRLRREFRERSSTVPRQAQAPQKSMTTPRHARRRARPSTRHTIDMERSWGFIPPTPFFAQIGHITALCAHPVKPRGASRTRGRGLVPECVA